MPYWGYIFICLLVIGCYLMAWRERDSDYGGIEFIALGTGILFMSGAYLIPWEIIHWIFFIAGGLCVIVFVWIAADDLSGPSYPLRTVNGQIHEDYLRLCYSSQEEIRNLSNEIRED